MLFSLARFESRLDKDASLIFLQDQDRLLWDRNLIAQAMQFLSRSIQTDKAGIYQLQAGIAAEHCLAQGFESTNWESIYRQYEVMEAIDSHMLVKINKAIALFFLGKQTEAIASMLVLKQNPEFDDNITGYLTLGVLYHHIGNIKEAGDCLNTALSLAHSERENAIVLRRLAMVNFP